MVYVITGETFSDSRPQLAIPKIGDDSFLRHWRIITNNTTCCQTVKYVVSACVWTFAAFAICRGVGIPMSFEQ